MLIEDAGSSAGVHVNGARIDGPVVLAAGDRIALGRVRLEFVTERGSEPPRGGDRDARFDLCDQRAGTISNVAGNQANTYNEYGLHIAPLRRRARLTIRLGVLLAFAGIAVAAAGMLRYLAAFADLFAGAGPADFAEMWGELIPAFTAGMATHVAGLALIVTGLLMKRQARKATR